MKTIKERKRAETYCPISIEMLSMGKTTCRLIKESGYVMNNHDNFIYKDIYKFGQYFRRV